MNPNFEISTNNPYQKGETLIFRCNCGHSNGGSQYQDGAAYHHREEHCLINVDDLQKVVVDGFRTQNDYRQGDSLRKMLFAMGVPRR